MSRIKPSLINHCFVRMKYYYVKEIHVFFCVWQPWFLPYFFLHSLKVAISVIKNVLDAIHCWTKLYHIWTKFEKNFRLGYLPVWNVQQKVIIMVQQKRKKKMYILIVKVDYYYLFIVSKSWCDKSFVFVCYLSFFFVIYTVFQVKNVWKEGRLLQF